MFLLEGRLDEDLDGGLDVDVRRLRSSVCFEDDLDRQRLMNVTDVGKELLPSV